MAKTKHGGCYTNLYNVWKTMRQRCNNPNNADYRWYGGKGVHICKEWDYFENFNSWAYESGYKRGLTIDRIDGDKDYSPDNCRWITIQEQQKNKKNVIHIERDGKQYTIQELCDKYGITKQMFYDRKHKGWSLDRILNTPKVGFGGYRRKGEIVYRG